MDIVISGYGRMGKAVEETAIKRGHTIHCIMNSREDWKKNQEKLNTADMVIDFSGPGCVADNISRSHSMNLPVVTGTTAWDETRMQIIDLVKKSGNTLFFAPNFSIGVNLLFELNRRLSELMSSHPQYKVKIDETHHIHKLDAPSGTAIALANDIINKHADYSKWAEDAAGENEIPVISKREGEIIGDHKVSWQSEVDNISIEHHAKSRHGFALGAVIAAEWVKGKKGYFEMTDMLFSPG